MEKSLDPKHDLSGREQRVIKKREQRNVSEISEISVSPDLKWLLFPPNSLLTSASKSDIFEVVRVENMYFLGAGSEKRFSRTGLLRA